MTRGRSRSATRAARASAWTCRSGPSRSRSARAGWCARGRGWRILSFGARLQEALKAADELAARGISTTVADARFAKPLDVELIGRLAREHELMLTHRGGLDRRLRQPGAAASAGRGAARHGQAAPAQPGPAGPLHRARHAGRPVRGGRPREERHRGRGGEGAGAGHPARRGTPAPPEPGRHAGGLHHRLPGDRPGRGAGDAGRGRRRAAGRRPRGGGLAPAWLLQAPARGRRRHGRDRLSPSARPWHAAGRPAGCARRPLRRHAPHLRGAPGDRDARLSRWTSWPAWSRRVARCACSASSGTPTIAIAASSASGWCSGWGWRWSTCCPKETLSWARLACAGERVGS